MRRFKQLYSRYQRSRDLISVGAYVRGSDPLLDEAIALYPQLEAFLQQDMHQSRSTRKGERGSIGPNCWAINPDISASCALAGFLFRMRILFSRAYE